MIPRIQKNITHANTLILMSLCFLAFCAYVFYAVNARSMADDFYRIAEIRSDHVLARAALEWSIFNPRFISMLIEYGLAKFEFLYERHYLILTIVYFLIFSLCFYTIQLGLKNYVNALKITLILFCIPQFFFPYGENLFFFTAAVEYFFPAILCISVSAIALTTLYRPAPPALYVFSIIIPLLHEVIGMIYVSILVGFFWINLWLKTEGQRARLLSLLAALGLAGGTILAMMLSPGVARRMESSHGMPWGKAFAETWATLPAYCPSLLAAPFLAFSLAAVLSVGPRQRSVIELLQARPWVRGYLLMGLIALATLVPLAIVTATLYGQGATPRRQLDALFLIAFAAIMAVTWLLMPTSTGGRTALYALAPAGVVLGLMLHPRPVALWSNAAATVENRKTFDRRIALADAYRGQAGHLIFTDHIQPATVLPLYFDIGPDPQDYRNRHFAAFLGVTCVERRPAQPDEPQSVVRSPTPCPP